MDVRLGYKQTDIGVIPEDWETPAIIDAAPKIIDYRGRTPRKLGMDWGGGDIPALSARNVKMGFIDFDEECNLGSESLYMRWMTNGDAAREDIVFTTEAPLGNVALIPDDQRYILSQRTILLKTDSARVYSPFLFQLMLSDRFQKLLAENASGSTAQGIQRKKFETLRIACPPVVEQCAIAAALSDTDALLAGLDRLIAKKRDLKQAAMQQLLTGQTRLPGFQGEWEEKRLGDTASLKARIGWQGLTTAEYLDSGDFYLVTGTEFSAGYIDWSHCHFVEQVRYKQDPNIQLRPRDVLVTKDGTIGKVALVTALPGPATLNSGIFVIRPLRDSFHPEFFYYVLCSRQFRAFLSQLAAGSTISHLYQKDFVSFVYRAPASLEEQEAIANVLGEMDAELTALEARRDKTRSLKQGMMQELLTGRTRLI